MDQKKIGKFIQELRKENKLTQEDLATKLNITKNAVSKWERGISMMDISLLKPLSEILGVSITEILNGGRIKENNIKDKSDEVVNKALILSDNKMKREKYRSILFTCVVILISCFLVFFLYKGILLYKYSSKEASNSNEVAKSYVPVKTLKIYKRTIPEDEYLILDKIKIRNDFKNYELEEIEHADFTSTLIYRDKENSNSISFPSLSTNHQLITVFTAADVSFYGEEATNIEKIFNSTDRKYFLLKNDINDDLDLFNFISKNYYVENNIFMSKREMMENYSFNKFVEVVIPKVDEFILIKGDYEGYIQKINNTVCIQIIRDDVYYGFIASGDKFNDLDYLIDLIGTIEIE